MAKKAIAEETIEVAPQPVVAKKQQLKNQLNQAGKEKIEPIIY